MQDLRGTVVCTKKIWEKLTELLTLRVTEREAVLSGIRTVTPGRWLAARTIREQKVSKVAHLPRVSHHEAEQLGEAIHIEFGQLAASVRRNRTRASMEWQLAHIRVEGGSGLADLVSMARVR